MTHNHPNEFRQLPGPILGDEHFFRSSNFYTYLIQRPRTRTSFSALRRSTGSIGRIPSGVQRILSLVFRRRGGSWALLIGHDLQQRPAVRDRDLPDEPTGGPVGRPSSFVVVAGGEVGLAEVLDRRRPSGQFQCGRRSDASSSSIPGSCSPRSRSMSAASARHRSRRRRPRAGWPAQPSAV